MNEYFLFSDTDLGYYYRSANWCNQTYQNTPPGVLFGLFTAVGLPIGINLTQLAFSYFTRPAQPTMKYTFEKRDLESQATSKLGKLASLTIGSVKYGYQKGSTAFKLSCLAASVLSFAIPKLLSMSRREISRSYPALLRAFQWLPNQSSNGLLSHILLGSAIFAGCMGGYDFINKALYKLPQKLADVKKPILNEELNIIVERIIDANRNAKNYHRNFTTLLLSGPPGTGKTTLAHWIARQSGMNYSMISGSDITQFINHSSHVTMLNGLFAALKNQGSPTVLFIDEAETILKNRDLSDHIYYAELLHAFLKNTEGLNDEIMVILATNRFEDIDPSVLDRMDFKLEIPLPTYMERNQMIQEFVLEYIPYEKQSLFSDAFKQNLTRETDGFSGRRILKMFSYLATASFKTEEELKIAIWAYMDKKSK